MSTCKYFLALIFLLFCSNFVSSSKILIAQPSPSRSHVLPVQVLAKLLAEKGHEVTYITAFPLEKSIKNYRDIKIEIDENDMAFVKRSMADPGKLTFLKSTLEIPKIMAKIGNNTIQSKEVQKLMREESFDLVIVGYFFSEYLFGLGDHFKCPIIVISPVGMFQTLASMVGNPLGIPAAPHIGYMTGDNSFFSRLANAMIYGVEKCLVKFIFDSSTRRVYE